MTEARCCAELLLVAGSEGRRDGEGRLGPWHWEGREASQGWRKGSGASVPVLRDFWARARLLAQPGRGEETHAPRCAAHSFGDPGDRSGA